MDGRHHAGVDVSNLGRRPAGSLKAFTYSRRNRLAPIERLKCETYLTVCSINHVFFLGLLIPRFFAVLTVS